MGVVQNGLEVGAGVAFGAFGKLFKIDLWGDIELVGG